jgi:hypothetical protein
MIHYHVYGNVSCESMDVKNCRKKKIKIHYLYESQNMLQIYPLGKKIKRSTVL